MGRDVPFKSNMKCDVCGTLGAFDFMGDYMCQTCTSRSGGKFMPRDPTPEMIDAMLRVDGRWSVNMIPRVRAAFQAAWDVSKAEHII